MQIQSINEYWKHTNFNVILYTNVICYPCIIADASYWRNMIFLILWHVKTTSWVWSQRADSDSESPPERPGTQTNGYFHIKHFMQQAKSHHTEGLYSFVTLRTVTTTFIQLLFVEMYYFIVYTDHMGLTRSGSFRVVPDFSTSRLQISINVPHIL